MLKIKDGKEKGITLIALVITIIVLLILANVSIATLTGENGILKQANKAIVQTNEKALLENVQLEILSCIQNTGEYDAGIIKTEVSKKFNIPEDDITKIGNILKINYKGFTIYVDTNGVAHISNGVKATEDHIGDFVNYKAGNWTTTEINSIGANNSTSQPTGEVQFGGFIAGSSRDGSATPVDATYNYIQETTDQGSKQPVTGWRIFDVGDDGSITLISAGCPENFKVENNKKTAYVSEYILTGNIDQNADASALGLGDTYHPRDWSMYLNSDYKETGSARVFWFEDIYNWYDKYLEVKPFYSGFKKIYDAEYKAKYESLIDNYSYYWLGHVYQGIHLMGYFNTNVDLKNCYFGVAGAGVKGVRVLITLPAGIGLSAESVGTKTITSRGVDYVYKIWDLE